MTRIFPFLCWFTRKENVAVCLIAAIVLVLHLLIITKPTHMVFDENAYVPAAKSFLTGGPLLNPEHPPLGKELIATGILFFGDNAIGWRLPSIIFGTASIFIFYLICIQLVRKEVTTEENNGLGGDSPGLLQTNSWFKMKIFVPVFATFLFAFENLSFIEAHVATLDVFYVSLMLLGFLLYLRGNYWSCGIAMGLSILCKVMAIFGLLTIILHWAITHRHEIALDLRRIVNILRNKINSPHFKVLLNMSKLLITVVVLWFVLLPLLEYPATHTLINPISRAIDMLRYHLEGNSISHPSFVVTTPWSWVLSPISLVYWPGGYLDNGHLVQSTDFLNYIYFAATSWNIWVLIIPSILYSAYEVIKFHVIKRSVATFVLSWFLCVYILLIPLELITNRRMYTFYFYPAIPAVCLAIAWSAWKLWSVMRREKKRRVIFLCTLVIYIASSVVIFFFMSPFGGHLILHV